jgi:reductive dehalogenase
MKAWPTAPIFTNSTFLGPTAGVSIVTPESLGMPKWQGSPEENTRMMRAAARFYGAGQIGGAELHQKLVFTYIKHGSKSTANDNPYMDVWPPPLTAGPKIEFINEDIGYETEAVKYLPDRHLTEVGVMIPMAREAWRTADPEHGSQIANAANISRYRMWACSVQPGLQAFLRGLGYHGYGYPFPDMSGGLVPSLASAVLGGISEMGRSSEIGLNPEVGSVGGYYSLLTDLPMAEDKPIDAGLFRFCHTCHKCANSCPADAISQDGEPTWDIPNFGYKVPQMNMMGGKRLFWTDTHACARYRVANPCIICRPTCTFNVNDAASVHEIIHGTVATTSVLNGFFWGMSKTFGYGLKDPDEWWDMSLPMWGTDSTAFANNGGYK